MNKSDDAYHPLRCWILRVSVSSLGAVLAACGTPSETGSNELSIQPLAIDATLPAEDPWKKSITSFDGPIIYRFDTSDDFLHSSDIWLSRGSQLAYQADQGNYGPGSIYISDRTKPWHGPLIRLPRFEAGQAYRVNVWVKLVDTSDVSIVNLILNRVVNGNKVSITLSQTPAKVNGWRKVEGEFLAIQEDADNIATLHLEVPNLSANYYVDDLVIAPTEASAELEAAASAAAMAAKMSHIRNGDLEDGRDHWAHQGGNIAHSSVQAHSGKYSLQITNRSQSWHAPIAPVYGLQDNTRYHLRLFVRLMEGQPPSDVKLTLKRITNGQATYDSITQTTAVDFQWTEVSGYYSAPNVSQSEVVSLYLECLDATASYYIDTLTVQEAP